MWINEVQFPPALVDAHMSDSLVIFVGAGASLDPPSELPDFQELTRQIVADSHLPFTATDQRPLDYVLGDLADRGVDVHRHVERLLDRPGSAPNRLHRAIVNLATGHARPRIVTTNYDRHLSTALFDAGHTVREFVAPALPLGGDFEGIVYLHGRLGLTPRHLVVTDHDFGAAYLRDAWASRFLQQMFSSYSVLFIGYSHDDVVMRYLGRALPDQDRRFVLTHEPDLAKWQQLGITPIAYPLRNGAHDALAESVEGWSARVRMGALDHAQEIARLTALPPSGVPAEDSYLEDALSDSTRARLFGASAHGHAWLEWATERAAFRRLFDPNSAHDDALMALARWFVTAYVSEAELTSAALNAVTKSGGRLSSTLWFALAQHLHGIARTTSLDLGPWVVLLIGNDPGTDRDALQYVLTDLKWETQSDLILLLFDYLIEPVPATDPGFGRASVGFEAVARGSHYWLNDIYTRVIKPNLAEVAAELLTMCDRHLRRATLFTQIGRESQTFDRLSFRRSSINDSSGLRQDPFDVLIDVARDALEHLVTSRPELARARFAEWEAGNVPLLRKLALYGRARRNDLDADDQIDDLIGLRAFMDHHLRAETFLVVDAAAPTASPAAIERLIGAHERFVEQRGSEQVEEYERFSFLLRLHLLRPADAALDEKLRTVETAHPEFKRDGVRLDGSGESFRWIGSRGPVTVPGLEDAVHTDPAEAMTIIDALPPSVRVIDEASRADALERVGELVSEDPKLGLPLLEAAGNRTDVHTSVVSAWSRCNLEQDLATTVLRAIHPLVDTATLPAIADLLNSSRHGGTRWSRISGSRDIAKSAWAILPESATAMNDVVFEAFNSPAGNLAAYWLSWIEDEFRAARDSWAGLDDETKTQLDSMLSADGRNGSVARAMIAGRTRLLHAADRPWTIDHLLPLFDWGRLDVASEMWSGFLHADGWSDLLLDDGHLAGYVETARRLEHLADERKHDLLEHVVSAAFFSTRQLDSWIDDFIVAAPPAVRVEWCATVGQHLSETDRVRNDADWVRWLRAYWDRRISGRPIGLGFEEASEMAAWPLYLQAGRDEAVTLATKTPAKLTQHGRILWLLERGLAAEAPAAFGRLVAHLVTHSERGWAFHQLPNVYAALKSGADAHDLRAIREAAVRVGIVEATDW